MLQIKDYFDDPITKTQTPHIHNIHVRCPVELWKRFRKSFPEKGDLIRVVIRAIELYLDIYEERQSQGG